VDPARNWPDLGPNFENSTDFDDDMDDRRDLDWSAVLKRQFEGYIRGTNPNMYGEWMVW
jgi:WD repeat and SOF domain-containing protein 1